MMLPTWICPAQPVHDDYQPIQARTVKIADIDGIDEQEDDNDGLTLEGKPLKRSRAGGLPMPGTQARKLYDATPIRPTSATAAEIGAIAKVDGRTSCSVLGQLADRKVSTVRRVWVDDVLRWMRDQ